MDLKFSALVISFLVISLISGLFSAAVSLLHSYLLYLRDINTLLERALYIFLFSEVILMSTSLVGLLIAFIMIKTFAKSSLSRIFFPVIIFLFILLTIYSEFQVYSALNESFLDLAGGMVAGFFAITTMVFGVLVVEDLSILMILVSNNKLTLDGWFFKIVSLISILIFILLPWLVSSFSLLTHRWF